MKFPAYPSKGKLVADTVRDILNYIRATRITKVIGGKLKVTPNGTTIDVSTSSNRPSEKLHFKVTGAVVDGSNYKCRIRGGWCLNRVVSSGTDAVTRVLPQISIDSVLTDLPPEDTAEIVLTAGQYVYLKVTTDPNDEFDDPPTIVAGDAGATSTQAQPPDESNGSGTDGEYYYPIAYLDSGVIKQIQQGGPMRHDPLLWEGENIGSGARVFKDRDTANNTYRFRSLIGGAGITATEGTSDITFDLEDAENLNLTITNIVYSTADLSGNDAMIIVGTPSEEVVLYWRNGLFVGTTDPGDSPVGLIERTVTHLEAYVP